MSSKDNAEIFSSEIEYSFSNLIKLIDYSLSRELSIEDFNNLDSWVNKELLSKYEKDILNPILRKKKNSEE